MKRLYFLVPDVDTAARLVDELREIGTKDADIAMVGKDHHALETAHLHEAGTFTNSDFGHAVARGVALGGGTGLLAGIAAVTFPPAGLVLGGGAILGMGALGAGFGAWASSLIGISVPERGVKRYEEAIDNGNLLMLVDVPRWQAESVCAVIRSHHPEVEISAYDRKLNTTATVAALAIEDHTDLRDHRGPLMFP
ncbi:hypothetical protein [Permianibacter fluminis]|uniref:hypothetical protein n=1 Tax=Permianibacter fluminis TaxID=2738515 RepID=UPI001B7D8ACB|nr:hypothetical protein [Permianibacter fluminis]